MSNEMIERVARAMHDNTRNKTNEFNKLNDFQKQHLILMAEAAILAMREPTTEMLNYGHGVSDLAETVYWVMIDAALQEE